MGEVIFPCKYKTVASLEGDKPRVRIWDDEEPKDAYVEYFTEYVNEHKFKNSYIREEKVLVNHNSAELYLIRPIAQDNHNIAEYLYELYKIQFMYQTIKMDDYLDEFREYYLDTERRSDMSFREWIQVYGFQSRNPLSFEEFVDKHFLCKAWMTDLLQSEMATKWYLEAIKPVYAVDVEYDSVNAAEYPDRIPIPRINVLQGTVADYLFQNSDALIKSYSLIQE